MSADHSEARERARQEFEKCLRCLYIQVPAEVADFIRSKFDEYEAAGRSLEQERWVSVEERLPEPGRDVLIFVTDDYEGNKNYQTVDCTPQDWTEEVTHWMPTPAPPVHKGDS